MKANLCRIYVGLIIALCLFFSVGAFFFGPDADTEGRELSPMPALRTEEGKLNLAFTTELEAAFADRFALRSQLVTAQSILRAGLFGTGNEKVIVGRGGYLFFGDTLDDYLGRNPMTDAEIEAAADALARMSRYAEEQGAKFIFTAAPNKNTLYGEYMPARYLPRTGESDMDRLFAALDARAVDYLDLRDFLTAEDLYHKRDTHWNGEGARLAYGGLMSALNLPYDDYLDAPYQTVTDFPGDLDALLTPTLKRTDENVVYTLPEFVYTSNYVTPMDLIISTRCDTAPERSALIFRDSFGSALIPYFSSAFSTVTYERANPYRIDQLTRKPADVVIVEIAERNLRDLVGAAERLAGK